MPKPESSIRMTFSPKEVQFLHDAMYTETLSIDGEVRYSEEDMNTARTSVHFKIQRAHEKIKKREEIK
jgi:hypothetical protein